MKTAVITGGNTGLGYALAQNLCKQGDWHIIIASRNVEKAQIAASNLEKISTSNKVEVLPTPLNLLSQTSVRNYVGNFPYPNIDLLVLNAGAMLTAGVQYSEEGIEAHFAGNHLGHYLLTLLFISQNKLKSTDGFKPARVVVISSGLHNPKILIPSDAKDFDFKFDFDNIKGEKFESKELVYDGALEYRKSKLANVWFAYELDRYITRFVPTTDLKRDGPWIMQFMFNYILPLTASNTITVEQSANHIFFVCTSDRLDSESGSYYATAEKGEQSESSVDSYNLELAKNCWNLSAELTNMKSFVY